MALIWKLHQAVMGLWKDRCLAINENNDDDLGLPGGPLLQTQINTIYAAGQQLVLPHNGPLFGTPIKCLL